MSSLQDILAVFFIFAGIGLAFAFLAFCFASEFSEERKDLAKKFRKQTPLELAEAEYAKRYESYTIDYIKMGVEPGMAKHLANQKLEKEFESLAEVDPLIKDIIEKRKAQPPKSKFSF